ncbi:MAG: Hpt domain-containing protein [Eubacteriales bacterium]|nr:Hpt domain-containing protein [Eubacteriales bacterium]MDD3881044.1 Hpt domain-containing protein [Eubacteriales bacterium]MDD4511887.1 Hpt domain-containing protein [Eubacteriales bacterium]
MDAVMLAEYGIDYEKALGSCMGNEAFLRKILTMYLDDVSFGTAESAFKKRDCAALFLAVHELKGVAGNAGFVGLYAAVLPLVELTRSGKCDWNKATELFENLKKAYERTIAGILRSIPE